MAIIAAQPVPKSLLRFFYDAIGLQYVLLLSMAAIIGFAITLIVVIRGRGTLATAALLFAVPLPFVVGMFGALDGAAHSLVIISQSDMAPKSSEVAQGVSVVLITPMVGMFLMSPSYAVAMFGSLIRSFLEERSTGQ
jgi:hypothetical protein